MPDVLDAGLLADYGQAVTTFTRLLKIKWKRGGAIFGFTSYNRDLTYDAGDGDGPIVYKAKPGAEVSAHQASAGFKPDNLEVGWILDDDVIKAEDLLAGKWNGARYTLFEVNYLNLTSGRHRIIERGEIGKTSLTGERAKAQARPLTARFSQQVGRSNKPGCPYRFGDANCGVRLLTVPTWSATTAVSKVPARRNSGGSIVRPSSFNDREFECSQSGTTGASEPTWNTTPGGTTVDGSAEWVARRARVVETTIDVVTSDKVFSVNYTGDAPDSFFLRGRVAFLTGAMAGDEIEIKAWDLATKTITLLIPAKLPLANTDQVRLFAGCQKNKVACQGHRNIERYGGQLFTPGQDEPYKIRKS